MSKISIIIPAYQAEKLITRTLEILLENYNEKIKNGDVEIIVINDGSTDKTQEILEKYTDYITILKNERNMGKGFSIRKAYVYSQSDYVVYTDADLPYGVESIQKIIDKLIQGRLCVIGERKIVDGNWFRELTHWAFLMCEKVLFGLNLKDTQCGIKGFKTNIVKEVSKIAIINGFAFEVEFLFLLKRSNIKIDIQEVPSADYSQTTIRLGDIITMAWDLFRIRIHRYNLKNLKNNHDCF